MNLYENLQSVVKEIEANFAEIKTDNQALMRISRNIGILRAEVNKNDASHVLLQECIAKIGVDMPQFAMEVANASTGSEMAEYERKSQFRENFLKYKGEGMTIGEAEKRAEQEVNDRKKLEIEMLDKKLRVKYLWEAIQIMITTIQTRLGMAKTEMMMLNQK